MMARRFNSEGYADPTAYEALKRIEKQEKEARYRPLVYICSPFSGKVKRNKRKARKYCRFALEQHTIPFAPHLLFPQFMDDNNPEERQTAMFMNMVMLGKCEQLWVFGENYSNGMKEEIRKAKERRKKIRYFTEKMEEIL
ncbi:MAG: DUF4406 domain-containing protein [Oscillospiraceae bacterium]|nr:DUF4406 domain-containing protein [Oscillospiraceae bacterium]